MNTRTGVGGPVVMITSGVLRRSEAGPYSKSPATATVSLRSPAAAFGAVALEDLPEVLSTDPLIRVLVTPDP